VAAGKRVDIGARSLYLDCRGRGTPTVVLEAGSGSDSTTWFAVHDELAAITRTCAYDRAGRGRSDQTERRSLAEAAAELRTLLATAGEPGPYVLVGHSLGGAFVRVFAADDRADVAGIVLVDTFDPDLHGATNTAIAQAWVAAYESLSPGQVRFITAWGAGHNVHIERPDLVIESVRHMVDLARSR
jgi:pimeloyl-ACP methyl ester carboxylesterase